MAYQPLSTPDPHSGEVSGTGMAQYSLGGTPSGATYSNPMGDFLWDATTNTRHNFSITAGTSSDVIQTGLDWTSPVVLFNLGTGYDSLGITFDSSTNTLWTSNWNGGSRISNYSLAGTLLSSLDAGISQIGGLAYDAADDTLWATQCSISALFQFSKSGTLLQSGAIAGLTANAARSCWGCAVASSVRGAVRLPWRPYSCDPVINDQAFFRTFPLLSVRRRRVVRRRSHGTISRDSRQTDRRVAGRSGRL